MRWVDLGFGGYELKLALDDAGAELSLRGRRALSDRSRAALLSVGFTPLPDDPYGWVRSTDTFTLSEILPAFPTVRIVDVAEREVIVRRLLASTALTDAVAPPEAAKPRTANPFQLPYAPASRVGASTAMVPINMAAAIASALARVESDHGPIDDFVARAMGIPTEELGSRLSCEQVDAVGLGLAANARGRGMIVADQTGFGKGRILGALAMAAAVSGKRVVFLTEKANLFSDFWRDLTDIGADGVLGRPYILNDDVKIIDVASKDGAVLFASEKSQELRRRVREQSLPDDCRIVVATHSQFNREGSPKAEYLKTICEGAFVVVDEAHNGVGDSNSAAALEAALEKAAGQVRSSATFASRTESLLSYGNVLPPSLRGEGAAERLAAGGGDLAEAISQYLAEDGVLIRREHDISGISVEIVNDDGRRDRNMALADALAPILSRMAKLARIVDDEAESRNEENEQGGAKSKELWYTANFGSRLAPLIRQFIAALTVDLAVDRAVASLERGEKPIIIVEGTMESLMRELAGDAMEPAASISEAEGDETRPPDFAAALRLLLDRILHISVRRGREDPEKIRVEDGHVLKEADGILELIDAFPELSLSPIDDMRDRIEAVGRERASAGSIERPWTCNEISARGMRVRDGAYERMPPVDRNAMIVGFNNGAIDALVITRAASTGLSLHASERALDQRRRRMIEYQIAKNVIERIQFWGRANRRGQTSLPAFETLCTGLPLQSRIMSMENRKLERLSANVSASKSNASAMDVPDMIDAVGNEAARRMLEDAPSLAERMCIGMKVDGEEAERELYFVNKLLQRLCLLSSAEQEGVFGRLRVDYEDAVAGLAAKGRSPRGAREMEGVWEELSRETLEPEDQADGPVFGRPVEIVTMRAYLEKDALSSTRVASMIAKSRERLAAECGNAAGPYFEVETKVIKRGTRRVLTSALTARLVSVDYALKTKGSNAVKSAGERLRRLQELLAVVQPGVTATVPGDEGELSAAVVTDVRRPEAGEEHLPGRWTVRYAIAGDTSVRTVSLASIIRDPSYTVHPTNQGRLPEPRLSAFDAAPTGIVEVTRKYLDGNLVKAVVIAGDVGAGSMVTMTDAEDVRRKSVLLSRRGYASLGDRRRRVPDATEGVKILDSERPLFTDHADRQNGAIFMPDAGGAILRMPSGRAGKRFLTPEVEEAAGQVRTISGQRTARVPRDRLAALLEAFMRSGHALHFDPPPKPDDQQGKNRFQRRPGR